jgi:CDP-paratose 2-epimerase
MKLLVTGSSGLIGSEAVEYFDERGHEVVGVDNNMRAVFFGPAGDTAWNTARLKHRCPRFRHLSIDIRDRQRVFELFERERFQAVIHTAAQPSHDHAATIPLLDFDVNAVGTINLLEANRQFSLEAPFAHLSTNKVYGDAPNEIPLRELETRWDYTDANYVHGIPETLRIDRSKHSLFGASKVAGDVMVQEYGRYFGMPTVCLRGGCLTGPAHAGVQAHGFLSYLVKCNVEQTKYTVFGYKAKQVRDNIHARDVTRFIERFIESPKSGAVYNLGGGKDNTISILEAFALTESVTGKTMRWSYEDRNREGDHICYYSDLRLVRSDYPGWDLTRDVRTIVGEIAESWDRRMHEESKT